MIYHVTKRSDWEDAKVKGYYEAASLHTEGFIHNSTKNQVAGVLDRYYKDEKELVLLHIDETKLTAPLKYELAPSVNEMFPHLYGAVNLDAIIEIEIL